MSMPVAGSRIDQALAMLRAGSDATAELLADVLWLANALPAVDLQGSTNPELPAPPSTREEGHVETEIEPNPGLNVPTYPNASPVFPPQPAGSDGPVIPATFIAVPAADALPNRLAIERALKPFLKRFPSRKIKQLNSDKTAEASADRRVVTPIFEPSPERWFDVLLLVERSDAMEVWTDTVRELRTLLDRHGAFRKVRVLRFSVRDSVLLFSGADQPLAATAAVDPDGRRLCLLLTNGTSEEWQRKPLIDFVGALGKRTVVAIVQMLPQKVWGHTALGDALERVRSELPGAPNAALQLEDPFSGLATRVNDASCVPALTLEPRSVARWANFVMSARRDVVPAIQLSVRPAATPRRDRTPAEKLSAFRAIGSPQAVRLLRVLAGVIPLTLPIMRLVQQSASPSREQFHLAEVMLSGLIQRVTPSDAAVPPDLVFYEFIPGVRQLLVGTLSSQESEKLDELMKPVQERLRAFVEAHAHHTNRYFAALVADTEGLEQLPASARSFFEVSRWVYEGRGIQPQTSSGPAVAEAAVHGPSAVPPPSRRIGVRVVGTGLIDLPKAVLYAAEQVGKAVANAGGTLIVGGWPGVDHVAARTFSRTYSENNKELNDQLVQVVEGTQEPDYAGGNPMRVMQNQGLKESLKLADIVILIGGAGGTWQAFQEALATNKQVIPLQNTGTDACHAAILLNVFGQNVQTDVMGAQFDTESQAQLFGVRLQQLIAARGSTTSTGLVDNRELLWMTNTVIPLARTYLQKAFDFDTEARLILKEFRSRGLTPMRYQQLVFSLATDPSPAWRCMAYLAIEANPDEVFAGGLDSGLETEVQLAIDHTETRPLWRYLAAAARLSNEHPEAFPATFSVRLQNAARTIRRRPRVDPGGECQESIQAILLRLRLNVTLDRPPQSAVVNDEEELTAQEWYQRGLAATDPDESIRYYDEAVRLRPEFADAFYNRAVALQEKGDLTGALQDYDETIRLNPRDADAYLNRGLMLDNLGDLDGALQAYNRAIDLYPDYADAFVNRGAIRQETSDLDGALQDYDQALRLMPDSAEVFYDRAITYQAKGDLERALLDFGEAIRLRPDYSDALYNRAALLNDRGDVNQALRDYNETIRLMPDDAAAYYNRAQLWEEKADYKRAIADYEEYLKLGEGLREGDQAAVEERIRNLRGETPPT